MNMGITLVLGTLTSILTMPFHLVAPKKFGSQVPMNFLQRLKQNMRTVKGIFAAFHESTIRIVQFIPFSMAHSLVMLFLKNLPSSPSRVYRYYNVVKAMLQKWVTRL